MGDNTRAWTAEEVARLKRMAGRFSRNQIAAKLGRTPAATAMEASKLKLSLRLQAPQAGHQRALKKYRTSKFSAVDRFS